LNDEIIIFSHSTGDYAFTQAIDAFGITFFALAEQLS
jgi:hypothetical protein